MNNKSITFSPRGVTKVEATYKIGSYEKDSPWAHFLRFMILEEMEQTEGIAWIEFAQPIYELVVDELNDSDDWLLFEGTYFERGPVILKLDDNGRLGVVGHFSMYVDTEMNMITDEDNIVAFIEWVQQGNQKDFPATKERGTEK